MSDAMYGGWDDGSGPDVHTLTGAYALGALDDVERRVFERHLVACPPCRDEVRGFRETAARLADGVAVAPSPMLRRRVIAEVRRTPQLAPLQREDPRQDPGPAWSDGRPGPFVAAPGWPGGPPVTDPRGLRGPAAGPGEWAGREVAAAEEWDEAPTEWSDTQVGGRGRRGHRLDGRRRRTSWLSLAAAVLVAAGGVGFGALQWQQARDADQARVAALTQERRIAEVLGSPGRKVLSAPMSSGGNVTVVVADGQAVVSAAGVAGLPAGRTYQLWAVRADGIRSLGLGPAAADAGGSWARPVDGVRAGDTVAVSVEPTGGSRQPTTTPLVAVKV